MPRPCAQCHRTLPRAAYSASQWRKRTTDADGTDRPSSRCKECVEGGGDYASGNAAGGANPSAPTTKAASTAAAAASIHSEVHTTPAGAMAVCADGDDSASRSGSEDGGGDGGKPRANGNTDHDAINTTNNHKEKEKDDGHVLFEPGEVEDFVQVGANTTLSPNSNADTATNQADLSAAETPKIRPARVVEGLSKSPGPPLPHFDLEGTAPIDVRSEVSAPTFLTPADSAAAAAAAAPPSEIPDAVHLPHRPQQMLERRISEVTAPSAPAVAPALAPAAAAAPAPALSREVTEEHSNIVRAPATVPPPAPPAAAAVKAKHPISNNNPKKAAQHRSTKSVNIFSARDAAHIAHRISTGDRIRVGICAMDKKARSKPMGEILSRLDETLFECVFFGDDLIKNSPIGDWPIVDVLIAFYSSGYPLSKAEEYVKLRRPFVLNDLEMQWTLKDRRKVYDLLESSGIDVPRHVYMSRDGYVSTGTGDGNGEGGDLIEHDDHIEVNGVVIHKPFVEKPVDADDHNIAIYYPTSAGGGCKKLFRKVGDRSSEFYSMINEVRRDGSYIYEEFVETQGTDVKMYTVGPDYGEQQVKLPSKKTDSQ